jgi:hypothetical protein
MASFPTSALAICAFLASGCWSSRSVEPGYLPPELTMEEVRFQVDRAGVAKASGEAERVTYRRDTSQVAATNLDLVLHGAEGEVQLQAPAATGFFSQHHFEATEGVTARRGQDVAVTRTAVYDAPPWDGLGGQVSGSDPVQVTGPGYQLDGRGFTLVPSSGELLLGGGARLVSGLPVRR